MKQSGESVIVFIYNLYSFFTIYLRLITVENQLVKFMLTTTVKRLLKFKRMYLSSFKDPEKTADPEVIMRIDDMVSKINGQLKNPVFSEVSKLKSLNTMSLVFQMALGYRDLYRYYL